MRGIIPDFDIYELENDAKGKPYNVL